VAVRGWVSSVKPPAKGPILSDLLSGSVGHGALPAQCWRGGACRLNISKRSPLNRATKPLPLLARDLEAEPPPGAGETGSIGRKAKWGSILALLLVIIYLIAQSAVGGSIPFRSATT
jgi:hypothetical protein